jgi:short subunit dehydrogenase-like uncharacterized protein
LKNKKYDLVVFGATSFVGQILSGYLWQRHGLKGELSWAMAGRSKSKLEEVRGNLGSGSSQLNLIVADASDQAALRDLCAQTKVVVSTVGPYALYGSDLVGLCAEMGVDYCDLTGEIQWIDRMIQAHEATAKASGARIVHCCGFDSIPSDMGNYFLQRESLARFKQPCNEVKMRVRRMKGEFSGGTVASMMNVTKELSANPSLAKKLGNPYLISPENTGTRQPSVKIPQYDKQAKSWVAPFIMAGINTRVVHRSNGLTGCAYGRDFKYDEAMMTGDGLKGRLMATGITAGLGGFFVAAAIPPARMALERFVVPKPGEGPSPQSQEKGHFDIRFFGATASGKNLEVKVTGDRDPGYGSTAKMLGEAAACLALDNEGKPGGFWTPSTLMGDALLKRLEAHSGLTFSIVE